MAYDALGNYVPGDDEPGLDQMRLALTKQPSLASQIPGYSGPVPKPERPLDNAELNFKSIAASLNPLMMMRTLRDAVNTAVVNPLLTPASIAVEAMQGKKITGSALAQPPTTPVGQSFEEGLSKAMDVAKVPHMGLLARPAGRRPALTPNDVRVMGAEATRMGRQIGDIPSDFVNAQSGLTRMDPVTNQPTYGAKLQGVAQGVGDLAQSRRESGLSLVPGVPDVFTPPTSMYAVRPSGSTIAMPQYPATTRADSMPKNTAAHKVLGEVVDEGQTQLSTNALMQQWDARRIDARADATPFQQYAEARALEAYPDAPSGGAALNAVSARYSDHEDFRAVELGWLNDFMQTPEGQASELSRVPSPAQLQARHEAATQWLYGPLLNYTRRHVGAVGDPLVKLASQGITYRSPDRLQDTADYELTQTDLAKRRQKSNLPAEGMVRPALNAKQAELTQAQDALRALQQQREGYRDVALQQGLADPAELPEYARTTRPIEQATMSVNKLEEEYNNLKVGALYEDVSDLAVSPRTRENVLSDIPYAQQQFYPSVTRARPDDIIYNMGRQTGLENIGLGDIARDFYNDVMSGKIPVEQVSKLSVDKFVRSKALPRIAKEKEEAKNRLTFKTDAEAVMRNTMTQNTTLENYFGNTAVIELSQKSGLTAEQFTRILSEPTTVLDHCIGQGGSAGRGDKNPWNPGSTRTYLPAYNVVTGQLDSRSGRQVTGYANAIARGDQQIADIRDGDTGLPVATLEFDKAFYGADAPRYNLGFVSGFKNGDVAPEYRDGVIAYLNSRADEIGSAGQNLEHVGAIDVKNASPRELANFTGKRVDDVKAADFSQLPRFVTREQIRAAMEAPSPAAPATSTSTELSLAHTRDQAALVADTRTSIQSAINNAADSAANAHNERVGDAVRGVLQGRIAEFLDGRPIEEVPAALRSLQTTIMDDEFQFSNSNSTFNNSIADGLIEFITDLEGAIDYHDRRLREIAAAPAPPPATVSMALQDIAGNGLDANDYATVYNIPLDTAEEMLARFRDPDMTMANVRGMRDNAMQRAPNTFFAGLTEAEAANAAQLLDVVIADTERAAQQAPDPLAAWAQGFEPDPTAVANLPAPARVPAIDYVGIRDSVLADVAQNVGMNVAERVETVAARVAEDINPRLDPARYVVALREAADIQLNTLVDQSLYDLADQIETAVAAQQLAAALPVNTGQQPTSQQVAGELFEMGRNADGALDFADLQNTSTVLQMGQLDHPAFRHIPPGPERAEAMQEVLDNFNRRVSNELRAQQPAPANDLTQMTMNQLAQRIDPNRWPLINARSDLAVVMARQDPDLERFVAAIRNGELPDTTSGLDMYEREVIAQNVRDALQAQPALVAQQPAPAPDPERRGPFRPGGSSAVRGMPLGNLNIQPSITASALRGPDVQPVRNFLQQVRSLPGVTQEGLRTGLMAFEQMDPTRQISKAEFVRELLPSSYEIVDLKDAADTNMHFRDEAEDAVADELYEVYRSIGVPEKFLEQVSEVVDGDIGFDDLPKSAIKALAKEGITDYADLEAAFKDAYKDAVQNAMEYIADMNGVALTDESGYTYSNTQRLVETDMGDVYGEFGVSHPDQAGTYHHFPNAEGLIGHIRGTYNPADPLTLKTATGSFTTKPNSYVIEEIQSDAQKSTAQVKHLHQVHGVIFKAAIQKALELGADTVYLPTAKIIASARDALTPTGEYVRLDTATKKFAPIYDQAVVKEGLKPLLKIPGVTSKIVNGYHEIRFTPEAKEHILNGPGQTIPGYQTGGAVKKREAPRQAFIARANSGIVNQNPSVEQMRFELMMRGK